MTIKSKLRNLLLVATLSPLLLSSAFFCLLLFGLGSHLAEDSKNYLIEQSHGYLESLIRDADLLVEKNFQLIDWILTSQKYEIEHRLQIEANHAAPQNLDLSYPVHERSLTGETLEFFTAAFQQLREKTPGLIIRQFVILPSGASYVLTLENRGMIPVDLSDQEWLTRALQTNDTTRQLVRDPQNQSLNLLISVPLQVFDKSSWGVTAVEISLDSLFLPLRLPDTWQSEVKMMLATLNLQAEKISIVAESTTGSDWQFLDGPIGLEAALSEVSADIVAAVTNNQADVLMKEHQDKIRHWAYGLVLWDDLFPLVMFEHEQVVSIALESEQHILGKIRLGIAFVWLGLLAFGGLAVTAAWHFSLTVTAPARKLSSAFKKLAKGDFTTRVAIETGDEIEELGHNFNDLGEKLEDRDRMVNSLALAREVQQNLLPHRPPVIEGIDLFSQGIPCDEIGGDYYDFIEHSEQNKNLLGIAVGDVTGHGVPAALLMASARGILRSHVWCHGQNLDFLFQLLNRHLTKDSAYDNFMTLFYAVLDRKQGTLSWNSAGHGPVLLYRSRSQTLVELEVTGPPLGIDEDLSFKAQSIENLDPGDILLAGTDGLWECRNRQNEIWGIDNLKNKLMLATPLSADEIGQFIFAELKEFQDGQKQEDDISLIIVKII